MHNQHKDRYNFKRDEINKIETKRTIQESMKQKVGSSKK
jgi:hypothetical protein